jgi:hypothetical protein
MSFQQWLQHGEMLYQSAMQEYHALEAQMDELERRLAAKQTELNQVAQMMGKPPIEGTRRVSAQLVTTPNTDEPDRPMVPDRPISAGSPNGNSASTNNIARALTGKSVRQPM